MIDCLQCFNMRNSMKICLAIKHPVQSPSPFSSYPRLNFTGVNEISLIREDIIENLLNHDKTQRSPSVTMKSISSNPTLDSEPEIKSTSSYPHTLLPQRNPDNDDTYDDPFDSKEEKIKDSKILIDELDPPRSSDFLPFPECDSVFYEDFSEVEALPSTNNETRYIFRDFNPPLYELPFHKEVSGLGALLSFSSENEEKVYNPGILTSKRVHTSLLPKLSHRGTKAFKVTKILKSPMEIFPCSYGEDILVMSSATSAVTYTSVYTDSEPDRAFWGADDEEIPEGAHDPDYVPEPIYHEYIPLEDEHEFPTEEQPLPLVDLPTVESPGYVTELDPEEDPEEYEDDETEDGPVDYPMDEGDDGDDDDSDSSRDDAHDEDEDNEDEEEEEEHLAPASSTIVVPVDEPVFPPKGTEPVIPPPSTDITIGARITVRPQTSISLPPEAEVERLLAMTSPSQSLPVSLSPPFAGERLARIASTQALIDAVTAVLPSPPLPLLPLYLYIPLPVDHRDEIPESEQPPRKRLYLSTLGSRYEVEESSTARPTRGRGIDYGFVSTVDAEERRQGIRDVGYSIRDTWVDPAEAVPEIAPMTLREVNTRVTELAELHEHDTQDLYALLEDAQDSRSRISQRVDMDSQRVDLLMGDRMTLQETVWMVEEEAYASREAWAHSIGLSQATHQELQTHRDHVRQAQMVETLRFIRDMRQEMSDMQAELLSLQEQQRGARQPGPEARILDHQDASGDADSHI
ncbi:hypothetical protein Tco_0227536 [Tanacetum coccineum]